MTSSKFLMRTLVLPLVRTRAKPPPSLSGVKKSTKKSSMRPPDLLQLQTGAIGRCGYGFIKKKGYWSVIRTYGTKEWHKRSQIPNELNEFNFIKRVWIGRMAVRLGYGSVLYILSCSQIWEKNGSAILWHVGQSVRVQKCKRECVSAVCYVDLWTCR